MSLVHNDVKKYNGCYSRGTCINSVWATNGKKILIDHISAKKKDIVHRYGYLFIYLFTGINKAKPVNPDPMYVTNLC